jgi:DNA-binding transcriptional MerR regulator/effector-binding domain-containing protein
MSSKLAIGDFSRATHLSVKMLRHYHDIGLLEPVDVDPDTGYRRYETEQITTAQIIRRFRDLEMPLDEIHALLATGDLDTRNQVIAKHLARLESHLVRTQEAVTSLRNLLDHPQATAPVEHRQLGATPAAVIVDVVDRADSLTWYQGALGELSATLSAQGITATEPAGGIYSTELFTDERGQAVIFVPCDPLPRPVGRVDVTTIPSADLATIVHPGPHKDIDRTYGALATYVTRHALPIDGPIREYYLVGPGDTRDESQWRTEVGWPIFQTRPP